jgi:hypothetical protein
MMDSNVLFCDYVYRKEMKMASKGTPNLNPVRYSLVHSARSVTQITPLNTKIFSEQRVSWDVESNASSVISIPLTPACFFLEKCQKPGFTWRLPVPRFEVEPNEYNAGMRPLLSLHPLVLR